VVDAVEVRRLRPGCPGFGMCTRRTALDR
jgi:hypothetical protein